MGTWERERERERESSKHRCKGEVVVKKEMGVD